MDAPKEQRSVTRDRRPWERPALKPVGTIGDVLRGGMGKLSITAGDPGETRKEPPTG